MIRYALVFVAIAAFVGMGIELYRMFSRPPPLPPPQPTGSVRVLAPSGPVAPSK